MRERKRDREKERKRKKGRERKKERDKGRVGVNGSTVFSEPVFGSKNFKKPNPVPVSVPLLVSKFLIFH